MLVKLMKHEFKSTYRFMLLLYGLLWITSLLSAISIRFELFDVATKINEHFQAGGALVSVFAFTAILLFILMNVITIVAIYFFAILRFKNNILENEGYLMHTLPVKTSDLLLSKTIVSVIWYFISLVAVLLSYAILFVGASSLPEINTDMKIMLENLLRILHSELADANILLLSAEVITASVFAAFASFLRVFASMAIGFSANKNRILKSIGVYILCGMITSTLESTVALLSGLTQLYADTDMFSYLGNMLWIDILLYGVYVLIYYLIAKHFLTKKLNLL